MEELKRKQDESIKEYKIRLCKNKDLYEISWDTVAELINKETGDKFGESKYRKWWYAYSEGYNDSAKLNVSGNEILDELEMKKIELELERKKKATINIEYNKLLREEARKQLIFDEIRQCIKAVEVPRFEKLSIQRNNIGALMSFSDVHFGKIFISLTNEYSEEIAQERMNMLLNQTIEICNKEDISQLTVLNVGDSIDGLIHMNQLMTLQSGLIDATIKFSRLMVEWLNELSKYVKITYLHIPSANHTELRVLGCNKGELPHEDLEKVIINYIHDMLKNNSRITVPIFKNDFVEFNICGYNFISKHGHNIKSLKNFIKESNTFYRKWFDYAVSAHLHHSEEITVNQGLDNNCELLLIPSIMGTDEYSDSLMVNGKAGAKFFIFEEGKGKTISYSINLN